MKSTHLVLTQGEFKLICVNNLQIKMGGKKMARIHFCILVLGWGVLVLFCSCGSDNKNAVGPQNQNPIISSIACDPDTVLLGETSTITVTASDPDGDPLNYAYTATGGTVSGSGNTAIFTTGNTPGDASVNVTVSDGRGGEAKSSAAFVVELRAKDGAWEGKTSQNRDISFTVINQGTEIDSGMTVTLFCSEYWGTVTITLTRTVPFSITDNEFTWSGSEFTVDGTFETSTHCTGDFSVSGNTGYPYYLPYSASGTWTADWISGSGALTKRSINKRLTERAEQYTVEKKMANEIVKITYELLE